MIKTGFLLTVTATVLLAACGDPASDGEVGEAGTDAKTAIGPADRRPPESDEGGDDAEPEDDAAPPQPDRVAVKLILISFAGSPIRATRSKEEADALAKELLVAVEAGEDMDVLIEQYSDDYSKKRDEGVRRMFNYGVEKKWKDEVPRSQIRPLGDLCFGLKVGESGMAEFGGANRFGHFIVKRIE